MNVYIVGVSMTKFGRFAQLSVKNLIRQAVDEAVADAGCTTDAFEAAFVAQTTQGHLEGQTFIPGPIALRAMGIQNIPMLTVENACASGSTAVWEAINFVRSGAGDVALAVGAEKMNVDDRAKSLSLFDGGWDISQVSDVIKRLEGLGRNVPIPEGSSSPDGYSVFMDYYASIAREHMERFGLTQRQIAAVASKNHNHSVDNERAFFRRPFTVEEILAAKPIAYPLTVPMCAPVTDGGAAAIICNDAGMARHGFSRERAVKVLFCGLGSGSDTLGPGAVARMARKAYEATGLGPEDISVAEVHDASAVGEVLQVENLGLCAPGEGGILAERGDTRIGGRIPVNPSGGLECKGHPIGASGLAQIFELVSQLRGECGARQVEGARFAMQENGGGLINLEEAVFVVSIFGKA